VTKLNFHVKNVNKTNKHPNSTLTYNCILRQTHILEFIDDSMGRYFSFSWWL